MKTKYTFFSLALCCVFATTGCGDTEKENEAAPAGEVSETTNLGVLQCPGINLPTQYAYRTDSLMQALRAMGTKPLGQARKEIYFPKDDAYVHDSSIQVFPLGRMGYANGTLVTYLLQNIHGQAPEEGDYVALVLYNKKEVVTDVLHISLRDVFSTRDINIMSRSEIKVMDIDEEYSPDPESEAEDLKNGYEPQPDTTYRYYGIDTVALKFKHP